jgi:hypothetical protein
MRSIEARLAELEKRILPSGETTVIIVKFVGKDGVDELPTGYSEFCGALRWDLLPGETHTQLQERAIREAPRGSGVAVLIESGAGTIENNQTKSNDAEI